MKITLPFYCMCLLLIVSGCHSLVDDGFTAYRQTPVLNAVLQPDSIIQVHLSFSVGLNDSFPPVIENAQVEIQSTEGWIELLTYAGEGYYVSSHCAKSEERYTCNVEIDGYATIAANTVIPSPTLINNVVFTPTASKDEDGLDISSVDFTIANDTTKRLFWEVRLIKEGMSFDWKLQEKIFKSQQVYIYMSAGNDLVLQNESLPFTVFLNSKMSDDFYKVVFYVPGWSIGSYTNGMLMVNENDNYYIELRSVDESYYHYQKRYYLYSTSGGTGFGSSAQSYPLYSNIENGLGVFKSYSVVRKQIEFNK